MVIPIDGEAAAIIADLAEEEGIPALAYDRMMQSENTDFWVQASMFETGRSQAQHVVDNTESGDTLVLLKGSPTDPNAGVIFSGQMDVLQPLFDSGERILGYENWTQGWDPAIARQSMDQALTDLDNNVQGVVSSNDGNAAAAIASLDEQGMAGTIPVSGLDGTVQALQLMLLGEQTQSVWRPFDTMADVTAQVVTAILNGESVDDFIDGTVENAVGAQIPSCPSTTTRPWVRKALPTSSSTTPRSRRKTCARARPQRRRSARSRRESTCSDDHGTTAPSGEPIPAG